MEKAEDIKHAKHLSVRFAIINLRQQCESKMQECLDYSDYNYIFYWAELKREFSKLLQEFDNGEKLNEDFLIKIKDNNIKLSENRLITKRLIKLIKITE